MSAPEPPAPATRPPERPRGTSESARHADQLLDEIGLEIRGDLEAVRLWRAAGARISGEWRVHVSRGLAREIVRRSAPREFTQHAREDFRNFVKLTHPSPRLHHSGGTVCEPICCSAPIGAGRACSRLTSRRRSIQPGTRRCAST